MAISFSGGLSGIGLMGGGGGEPPLPRLREDLALLPGPPARDGSPTWTIHDPVRDRYLRVGWVGMEMLKRWGLGRASAVLAAIARETTARVSPADIDGMARFLRGNDLVVGDDPASVARLLERHAARRTGLLSKAVHNYLFFRIPLIRPDRFLRATGRLVAPFYSAGWRWFVGVAMALGLFLVSRQWDVFVAGVADLMSWDGAAAMMGTLAVVKVLHEFGHAYTARRYGCPVPTMGVAFLVMWPVLYTDTTHAYRLVSRGRRLEVAAGGIMVELTIAALATLAWALLPDGALRTGCHAAATITWIGTVAINLNPFMRFDGYYLLSDALDVANLQDRAFARGKWWLRERLFGLGEPEPEPFPSAMGRFLIAYAFAVWIYRLTLFLGIALLVYHMAFKVLGIVLMMIEIVWFIALPIARELGAWWTRRGAVRLNVNTAATLGGLTLLGLAAFQPWSWPVAAPAMSLPASAWELHAPSPARLASLDAAPGEMVEAGRPLMTLELPSVSFQMERAERRIAALDDLIGREAAVADSADGVGVLREELESTRALLRGLEALRDELVLRAPFEGRLVDVAEPLAPGQWVDRATVLGRVVTTGPGRVVAFVGADDLSRVAPGASARFIGEDPAAAALPLTVVSVDTAAATTLDQPELSSTNDGPIAATPTPDHRGRPGALRPLKPVYRVELVPVSGGVVAPVGASGAPSPDMERGVRGRVWIDGPPTSLVERAWRAAAAVLLRESGF